MVSRHAFSHMDEILVDSDQTISSFYPMQATNTTKNSSDYPIDRTISRLKSSYFPDSTDDECYPPNPRLTQSHSGVLQSNNERNMSQPVPKFSSTQVTNRYSTSHAYIGEIEFPRAKSILWDRRALATPIICTALECIPRITIPSDILKTIWNYYQESLTLQTQGNAPLCYLWGIRSNINSSDFILQYIVKNENLVQTIKRHDGTCIWLPVYIKRDQELESASSPLQMILYLYPTPTPSMELQCYAPSMNVNFQFTVLRNLPLLLTPLAIALTNASGNSSIQGSSPVYFTAQDIKKDVSNIAFGYMTLDRARKAVPLLQTDPLLHTNPIVGIWVCGDFDLPDTWNEDSTQNEFQDITILLPIMKFLISSNKENNYKEIVWVDRQTFLLVIYQTIGNQTEKSTKRLGNGLPRFFECHYELLDENNENSDERQFSMEWISSQQNKLDIHRVNCIDMHFQVYKDLSNRTTEQLPVNNTSSAKLDSESTSHKNSTRTSNKIDHTPPTFHRGLRRENKNTTISEHKQQQSKSTPTSHRSRYKAASSPRAERSNNLESSHHSSELSGSSSSASAISENGKSPHGKKSIHAVKPCCQASQDLLTLQHQQILENQQNQLRELQLQISKLQSTLSESLLLNANNNSINHGNQTVNPPLSPIEDTKTTQNSNTHPSQTYFHNSANQNIQQSNSSEFTNYSNSLENIWDIPLDHQVNERYLEDSGRSREHLNQSDTSEQSREKVILLNNTDFENFPDNASSVLSSLDLSSLTNNDVDNLSDSVSSLHSDIKENELDNGQSSTTRFTILDDEFPTDADSKQPPAPMQDITESKDEVDDKMSSQQNKHKFQFEDKKIAKGIDRMSTTSDREEAVERLKLPFSSSIYLHPDEKMAPLGYDMLDPLEVPLPRIRIPIEHTNSIGGFSGNDDDEDDDLRQLERKYEHLVAMLKR